MNVAQIVATKMRDPPKGRKWARTSGEWVNPFKLAPSVATVPARTEIVSRGGIRRPRRLTPVGSRRASLQERSELNVSALLSSETAAK